MFIETGFEMTMGRRWRPHWTSEPMDPKTRGVA
jgi:hypothetical protein